MDYKQQSNQGCLVVNLLYLFKIEPTREKERETLSEGLFRLRDNYTLGCLLAFLDRYQDKAITVYVDNSYYLTFLKKRVVHPRLTMIYHKSDKKLLNTLSTPFIMNIDTNITNGWVHLPHFIMVIGVTEKFYNVYDPWDGKIIRLHKDTLLSGVELLRSLIKICPFVIQAG